MIGFVIVFFIIVAIYIVTKDNGECPYYNDGYCNKMNDECRSGNKFKCSIRKNLKDI